MLEEQIGTEIMERTRQSVTLPRAARREAHLRELALIARSRPPRRYRLRGALTRLARLLEETGRRLAVYAGDLRELD